MRGLKHFAAVGLVLAGFVGLASSVKAGSLIIDKYEGIGNPVGQGTDGAGALITAHYTGIDTSVCCPDGDIEFLQMITLTDGAGDLITNVPGGAAGPFNGQAQFIDPQPNKTLSVDDDGVATKSDGDPWYDFTYPSDPNAVGGPPAYNNGAGPYIYDRPSGWESTAQGTTDGILNFTATTLVVCAVEDPAGSGDGTATILGGFTWGFTVDSNPPNPPSSTTTLQPITAIHPGTYDTTDINDALDYFSSTAGGSSWQVDNLPGALCDECALDVIVPTPSALYGIPVCLVGLVAARRWYKMAA